MSRVRDLARLVGGLQGTNTLLQSVVDLVTAYGLSLTDQSERFGAGLDAGPSLVLLPATTAAQMAFARASTALARGSNGVLASFPVNGLRYDYRWNGTAWVAAGFLVEDARTNIVQRGSQFGVSPWGGAAVVAANSTAAPDGTATASTLTDSAAAATDRSISAIPIAASATNYEASIYLKRVSGTNAPSLRLNLTGGASATNPEVIYDLDNGLAMQRTASANYVPHIGRAANGFWRCGVTGVDTGGNTAVSFAVRPAYAQTYTTAVDVSATGSVYAWGADLKVGVGMTSVIPTPAGAAVPRAADILSKPLSARLARTAMSVVFKARFLPGSAGGVLWQFDDGTDANRVTVRVSSTKIVLEVVVASVVTTTLVGPDYAAETDFVIGFGFNRISGELMLRVNGTSYAGIAVAIAKPTYRRIGCNAAGTGQPNAWVDPFRTKAADGSLSATEFLRMLSPAEIAVFN